jgi:hypothetical protein
MQDKTNVIDRQGTPEEALEAMWLIVEQLNMIAMRLDPISQQLAQVPQEANALIAKLFEYLQSLQGSMFQAQSSMSEFSKALDVMQKAQLAQTIKLERMEKIMEENQKRLTMHIR